MRGFIGDIIIILLIYFFIKSFYDFQPVKLTIFILLLAFTTEFLQYLNFISILGLEQNIFAQLIIGAVFDPLDLIAYTIGAITAYGFDIKCLLRGESPTASSVGSMPAIRQLDKAKLS